MAKINWTPIIVTLIIALVFAGISGVYLANKYSSERTVSATGMADMTVMPDKAIVYLLVQTSDVSAETAKNQNSEISSDVIIALKALGIADSDIETQNYNIYPQYNWSSGTNDIIGYTVSNEIKVSSDDFENVGKIVDAAVDAGATINYINFDLSTEKQNDYKKLVLANASEDAREKAEAIASGLGKNLGSLISVSSSDYNYYPYPLYRAEMASGASDLKAAVTDISPQKLEVTGSVTVVYAIK